jgi:hypothetical protein
MIDEMRPPLQYPVILRLWDGGDWQEKLAWLSRVPCMSEEVLISDGVRREVRSVTHRMDAPAIVHLSGLDDLASDALRTEVLDALGEAGWK